MGKALTMKIEDNTNKLYISVIVLFFKIFGNTKTALISEGLSTSCADIQCNEEQEALQFIWPILVFCFSVNQIAF